MNYLFMEATNGIALLTINRPKALNVSNEELLVELYDTLQALEQDALVNGLDMGKTDGYKYESALFVNLFDTHDQQDGMNAFWKKDSPPLIIDS